MLNLEELVFQVNTKQLDDAAIKVDNLGTAVKALAKPLADSAKASDASSKVAEKLAKSSDLATKAAKEQESVLQRQISIYEFMTKGLSKGQAAVMARAKANGEMTDGLKELEKVLLSMRKLQGGDPFDKSASGLTALQNKLTEVREANRLYTAGIALTREQTRDLARDKERLIEKLKAEAAAQGRTGVGYREIRDALQAHNAEYIKTAGRVNALIGVEKEHERQIRDTANARRALQAADEKAASVVNTLTGSQGHLTKTSERAAESIARYSRNLRLSGVTGAEATKRLEAYKLQIMQIEKIEQKRKVDLLSRSLAPQISDVTVSLAGGMNPMTVLLQQGLQVRDLIGQSGVAAGELQKAFKSAASDMVSSIKGTASAIGSLLIGTIQDAGAAILNFGLNITGVTYINEKFRESLVKLFPESSRLIQGFDGLAKKISLGIGGAAVVAIAALVALAFAIRSVIKEETELSKAITLTGASMGLSLESAIKFADSMEDLGVSQSKATKILTEFAKAGVNVQGSLQKVTKAAADLNSSAGVAFEDTAKVIEDLGKKPTDSLIKFAIESGRVDVAILKQVASLEKAGNAAEATRIAQDAWANAASEQAATIYDSLSPVEQVWIQIRKAISGAWESFKEFARGELIAKVFATAWQTVAVIASEVWFVLKQTGKEIGGIAAQIAAVLRGDFSGAKSIGENMKADAASARKEQEKLIASIMGVGSEQKKTNVQIDSATELLKQQSDAARKLRSELDKKNSPKSDAAKEAEKVESFYKRTLRDLQVNALEAGTATSELTKTQTALLSILSDEKWAKLSEEKRQALMQGAFAAIAAEEATVALKKAEDARIQIQKEAFEWDAKRLDQVSDYEIKLRDAAESLTEQNDMLRYEATLIGLTSEERKKAVKVREIELKLAKELVEINEKFKNDPGLAAALAQATRNAAKEIENISLEAANTVSQNMVDSITDAVTTGLFEGGKAGSTKLRSIIEAELRKPITVFVQAVVGQIFGGGSSSGGSSGGGDVVSTLSNLMNGINASSQTGVMLAKGTAQIASQFGVSAFTDLMGGFASGMMSTASMSSATAALSGTGAQMAGVIVGSVMNGFAGYGISSALSGGYSTGGNTVNVIAGIASMIPGIGPIAGVIGGLVNRAFGRKSVDNGFEGTFGGSSGFQGNEYEFLKGGWFRSNKTQRTAMNGGTQAGLANSFNLIKSSTMALASMLNIATDGMNSYTKAIKISTRGKSSEAIAAELEAIFQTIQNDLAAIALAGTNLSKEGEKAVDTLTRLVTNVAGVNNVLEMLGLNLFEFSIAGADMASQLVDMFGTLDGFTSATQAYYTNFYSDTERAGIALEMLGGRFNELGLQLPTTVAEYRALVEAQDLLTAAGRENFTVLIQSSGVFKEATDIFNQATEAFADLGKAVSDEIARLRGTILTDSVNSVSSLQSQFAIATASARSGDMTALSTLPELSKNIETAFQAQAGSNEDVQRLRAWLADSLGTTLSTLGLPTFAAGGSHSGGLRLVGENGPELEVTGPSRIYSAQHTAKMLDSQNDNSALLEEIQMLRAEVRANVVHSAKISRILERVTPEGDSIVTSTLSP